MHVFLKTSGETKQGNNRITLRTLCVRIPPRAHAIDHSIVKSRVGIRKYLSIMHAWLSVLVLRYLSVWRDGTCIHSIEHHGLHMRTLVVCANDAWFLCSTTTSTDGTSRYRSFIKLKDQNRDHQEWKMRWSGVIRARIHFSNQSASHTYDQVVDTNHKSLQIQRVYAQHR